MSEVFSTLASLCIVAVVVFYFRQVVTGSSIPNPATWTIWAIITVMNTITYFFAAQEDWLKTLAVALATLGMCSVCVYSFFRGKFGRMNIIEMVCLFIAVAVGIFWKMTGDPIAANLLLQMVFIVSFIPTVRGLLKHELREKPLPWDLAVVAYTLMVAAVLIDWNNTSWPALVHPVVNGVLGNGSIAIIAHIQLRTK